METTEIKTVIKHIKLETGDWKSKFIFLYPDPSFLEDALNHPHVHFAAYNGEEIIGHALIQYVNNKWVLGTLVVKPEFRQRGIGKALTKARIDYAEKCGITKLWYQSENANLVAICCYVGLGFKKICPHGQANCSPANTHWYRLKISNAFDPELN